MSKKDQKKHECGNDECMGNCGDECECGHDHQHEHNHSHENILSDGNVEINSGVPQQFDEDTKEAIQEIQLLEGERIL